jgi:hypothetical protein
MATTNTTGTPKAPRKPAANKTATTAKPTASNSSSIEPKTTVEQVQDFAERVVLVQLGAGLLVRDNIVSTVDSLRSKCASRANIERELKRYERRGATARNRLERQVRKARTQVERDVRQRRTRVEKSVKENRRRVEREVRDARKDFERHTTRVTDRVEQLVSDARERLS